MLTDEMVEAFRKAADLYIAKMDAMPEDEAAEYATRELIEMGVLDENGNTKETIVTGDFFGW